jgi:hypothetical protein
MTRSSVSLGLVVALALAASTPVLVSACTPSSATGASRPTDDDLRELQSAHAVELEELRDAMVAEPVDVVGDDHVGDCWKESASSWSCGAAGTIASDDEMLAHVGLTKERHGRLSDLLHRVGASRVTRGADGEVTVLVYRSGIVTSPRTKGLVWSPERAPGPLVADTDEGRQARYMTSYARTSANSSWFIEHTGD